MGWLSFEHSPGAYRADFCVYGTVLLALGMVLWVGPLDPRLLGWWVAGAWGWTLLEYLLHRFVLHGLAPFKRWHLEHHRRPTALIAAPTLLSAAIFASVLLPAAWLLGTRPAAALGVGLLGGYLVYGLIHHAIHRPMTRHATHVGWRWLLKRRLWHGLHHRRMHLAPGHPQSSAMEGYYGVSSVFWDRVFHTDRRITSSAYRWPRR
jgi:cyclopropane-fatty-acyl-phospholipid synthase